MGRDDDADLAHLAGPIRSRLVLDDHHVVAEKDGEANCEPCASCQFLRPLGGSPTHFKGIEIDISEEKHCGPKLIPTGASILFDHAVSSECPDYPVDGRGREIKVRGDIGQPEPPGSLEDPEYANRSIDGLDHCFLLGREGNGFFDYRLTIPKSFDIVRTVFDNIANCWE
jgi:hypothetical protein